ncbi:ABC transporter ATP-binding protein [Nostoc sphaeroides]|uniref:ABC-2.LPSE.A, lipopolysaccharide transport system ATP-binding protein n=1 Tax=Nostoc sphaeroides CCNUC1 TaxID=2653204 RepID=A0A5P8WBZ2_9NOSO|nr:ABC transporter ATP-binding protein [Nostoc sphaeroides]QFS50345.1 ABC-2.LPSE.A, lipopolysaccharide transport system ATP-binding protein [Nostoc sphaeroides CCNUC1]
MSDTIIRVENLSKKYIIGHKQQESYTALRDVIANGAKGLLKPFQNGKSNIQNSSDEFWALKDVSFEIKQGDRVGIIGRNGAGKSTLLKILSRITEPTKGSIKIKGRVASLLEVGTGFHGELTGRENIFLNGAILGMGKVEIQRKFDEIVAFAEVEKFLDTPVKRYSSGMYVKLAFAVAAHLEPEILIIDEVLAVGDVQFQKKCLGKMEDVSKNEGRTVLFVSHNLGVVHAFCSRCILLGQGTVLADDTTDKAVGTYLRTLEKASSQSLLERTDRNGNGLAKLAHIEIYTGGSYSSVTLTTGYSAIFIFHVTKMIAGLSCCFTIYDQYGQPVTYFDSAIYSKEDMTNLEKEAKFICEIEEFLLIPGRYIINATLMCNGEFVDDVKGATFFNIEEGRIRSRAVSKEAGFGNVLLPHRWKTPI